MRKTVILTIVFIVLLATTATAGITYQLTRVSYPILVDGDALKTDKPILNYNGSTYLPLRAVSEAVGSDIQWDGLNSRVLINKSTSSGISKDKIRLLDFYKSVIDFGNKVYNTSNCLGSYSDAISIDYNADSFYKDASDWIDSCSESYTLCDGRLSCTTFNTQADKLVVSDILDEYNKCISNYSMALFNLKSYNDMKTDFYSSQYLDYTHKANLACLDLIQKSNNLYNNLYKSLTN